MFLSSRQKIVLFLLLLSSLFIASILYYANLMASSEKASIINAAEIPNPNPQTDGIISDEHKGTTTENSSTTVPTQPQTQPQAPGMTSNSVELPLNSAQLLMGMRMTFNENFNELSRYVDQNGNITCEPGGRGIWQSVYHFCSRTIAPNYDSQLYIDQNFIDHVNKSGFGTTSARNSTWVNDGILTIEVKPSDEVIKKAAGAWAKYTSGLLTTQFSFSQQYGYFEMRAQVPTGDGIWPAFWLLPIDKSWPPEIDVMESFGGLNRKGEGGNYKIHYASHTKDIKGLCGTWFSTGVDITAGFHTYGVNWQPDGITYYFDGAPYAFCPPNPDANQPFYMLVNVAVGSEPSWSGMPTIANNWPVYMYVDYVRAYQNK